MAEETSIARARRLATTKRKRREAREAAAAAAKNKPAEKATESISLIDRIRKAFSSEDDINRIDSAVDAVTSGVKDADKDNK